MRDLTWASNPNAGRPRRLKTIAGISLATVLLAGCGGPKAQGGGNPVKQGQPQMVHLVWKQATSEWKVKFNNDPNEMAPAQATTTLPPGTGPTKFVVDIVGHPTASFQDPGGLDIWEGSKSAPKQGLNSTQILGPEITKNGKLVFWDLNQGDPVTLSYTLHFNNGIPSVDPIIDNGGNNAK